MLVNENERYTTNFLKFLLQNETDTVKKQDIIDSVNKQRQLVQVYSNYTGIYQLRFAIKKGNSNWKLIRDNSCTTLSLFVDKHRYNRYLHRGYNLWIVNW